MSSRMRNVSLMSAVMLSLLLGLLGLQSNVDVMVHAKATTVVPSSSTATVRSRKLKSIFEKDKKPILEATTKAKPKTKKTTQTKNSCEDNQYYAFNNIQYYSCQWVRNDPGLRCHLVDNNNVAVRDRCRASCNNCGIQFTHGSSGSTSNISSMNSSVYSSSSNSVYNNNNSTSNNKRNQRKTSKKSPSSSSSSSSSLKKQTVGTLCTSNIDCASQICRENTCFASQECKAIKHLDGQEFHKDIINLVFVGSGFHNLDEWRGAVARSFTAFDAFEFFGFENPRYNAFYVDEYNGDDGFCEFDCQGISSLLCCDVQKARAISKKCLPMGPNLQTIVIENDERYGGGGYRYQNLATTSIHRLGPLVTVHELGHSLFELGDEYASSLFTSKSGPNCDAEGCPKWADLDRHMGGGLCETKGCQGGAYYIGQSSFMDSLDAPVGHVNLRFTCCTYLALTSGLPPYCEKYDFGNGLLEYCRNDYQKYGGANLYVNKEIGEERTSTNKTNEEDLAGKFTIAISPIILTVDLEYDGSFTSEALEEGPVLVRRSQFRGDYPDLRAVCNSRLKRILQIEIEFDSGEKKKLYFSKAITIEVPPEIPSTMNNTDITVQATTLEIIVEAQSGLVVDLLIKNIEITLWIRIRTWLSSFFSHALRWLFSGNDKKGSDEVHNS